MSSCFAQCNISHRKNFSTIVRVTIWNTRNSLDLYSVLLILLLSLKRQIFDKWGADRWVDLRYCIRNSNILVCHSEKVHAKLLKPSDFPLNQYIDLIKVWLSEESELPLICMLIIQIPHPFQVPELNHSSLIDALFCNNFQLSFICYFPISSLIGEEGHTNVRILLNSCRNDQILQEAL